MSRGMDIALSQVMVRLPGRPEPLFSISSLRIPTGSRILIHGPSGRGKTTLLHLLAGQFLPDAGTIHVGDKNLTALSEDARARLRREHYGIVFQRLNLLDYLTPLENVRLGSASKSFFPEAAAEALKRMGLSADSRQRCGTLSVGEQQRVAVARVLASAPDILLADEPTSSLDHANAETVMAALGEAAEGRTLIVVSHDQRIRHFFETVRDFQELVDA